MKTAHSTYPHTLSRLVTLGFIVGQKKSWKLIYFLFSKDVNYHLECNLGYQKYGMLHVGHDIYKYIYNTYSHTCTYSCTDRKRSCLLCCHIMLKGFQISLSEI